MRFKMEGQLAGPSQHRKVMESTQSDLPVSSDKRYF